VAWLRLLHPFPSVVVALTGLAFAWLAAPSTLGPWEIPRLLGLFLSSQLAIGAFNDFCDAELDAVAKPFKPIPSGAVPRRAALAIAALLVATTLWLGATFGATTLLLTVPATAAGLLYDFPFKRTRWSWLPYVLGVPLLPLWAWSAVGTLPAAAVWTYPVGALLALSLHLANALPDDLGDRAVGSHGLVQWMGPARARWLLCIAFAGALGLAVIVLALRGETISWALGGLGGSTGAFGILRSTRQSPSAAGFRLLAVGSGLLGIAVALALLSAEF
jgi:4-hydroxybenzoate polyprenyltransferase